MRELDVLIPPIGFFFHLEVIRQGLLICVSKQFSSCSKDETLSLLSALRFVGILSIPFCIRQFFVSINF